MRSVALIAALATIALVLWDSFETIVLPRTVTRRFRITRLFFRGTWWPWARIAERIASESRRERFLAIYGPVSLLGLLIVWAAGLVLGFGVLLWAAGSHLETAAGHAASFADDLYMSGTTFFTVGLGDVHPVGSIERLFTVVEGGMGLGFLAIVIAYFPVLYQSFSRREARLTLLDAWAGSPPAAGEVLRRLVAAGEVDALEGFLKDWEYWCSELLETHISYPVVAYFRSQHQRQSWVSALTTILDVSTLVQVGFDGVSRWQAHVTFAIARHAAVDLAQVLHATAAVDTDRLPPDTLEQLRSRLEDAGLRPSRSAEADEHLARLRRSYEPYVTALGRSLMMPLPPWWRDGISRDNWETSPRRGGAHL